MELYVFKLPDPLVLYLYINEEGKKTWTLCVEIDGLAKIVRMAETKRFRHFVHESNLDKELKDEILKIIESEEKQSACGLMNLN